MRLKTREEKFFQNFGNVVKIRYGSVVGQIVRIKVWLLDKSVTRAVLNESGKHPS